MNTFANLWIVWITHKGKHKIQILPSKSIYAIAYTILMQWKSWVWIVNWIGFRMRNHSFHIMCMCLWAQFWNPNKMFKDVSYFRSFGDSFYMNECICSVHFYCIYMENRISFGEEVSDCDAGRSRWKPVALRLSRRPVGFVASLVLRHWQQSVTEVKVWKALLWSQRFQKCLSPRGRLLRSQVKGGVEEKCQRKVRVSEGVRIFQMEGRGEGQSGTPEGRRPGGRRGGSQHSLILVMATAIGGYIFLFSSSPTSDALLIILYARLLIFIFGNFLHFEPL